MSRHKRYEQRVGEATHNAATQPDTDAIDLHFLPLSIMRGEWRPPHTPYILAHKDGEITLPPVGRQRA
jgi:hypothetical protein